MNHQGHNTTVAETGSPSGAHAGHESGMKHWAIMALCCLPMIVIAVVLIFGLW